MTLGKSILAESTRFHCIPVFSVCWSDHFGFTDNRSLLFVEKIVNLELIYSTVFKACSCPVLVPVLKTFMASKMLTSKFSQVSRLVVLYDHLWWHHLLVSSLVMPFLMRKVNFYSFRQRNWLSSTFGDFLCHYLHHHTLQLWLDHEICHSSSTPAPRIHPPAHWLGENQAACR